MAFKAVGTLSDGTVGEYWTLDNFKTIGQILLELTKIQKSSEELAEQVRSIINLEISKGKIIGFELISFNIIKPYTVFYNNRFCYHKF